MFKERMVRLLRANLLFLLRAFLFTGGSKKRGPVMLLNRTEGIQYDQIPICLVVAVTILCLD